MERRQPIVARLTRDGALVLATLLLVNAFAGRWPGHAGLRFHPLPWAMALLGVGNRGGWWFPTGWSMQESLGLGLIVALLLVNRWASVPRVVPEAPTTRSLADQLSDLEASDVVVTVAPTQASSTTRSIVDSILSVETAEIPDVSSAIAHLDADEVGQHAALVATASPAPHTTTEQNRSLSATTLAAASDRTVRKVEAPTPVTSIPLPGMDEAQPTSPPAERPASAAPAADFSANVPLPSLPDLDLPEDDDLDLDGLLEGLENVVDGSVSAGATSSIDSELDALLSGLDDLL